MVGDRASCSRCQSRRLSRGAAVACGFLQLHYLLLQGWSSVVTKAPALLSFLWQDNLTQGRALHYVRPHPCLATLSHFVVFSAYLFRSQ